jgi:hypothetical protein
LDASKAWTNAATIWSTVVGNTQAAAIDYERANVDAASAG